MRYTTLLGGLLLISLLHGCGSSSADESAETKSDTTLVPATGTTIPPASTAGSLTDTNKTTPGAVVSDPGLSITPSTTTPAATTNSGALNPEHGKPGHRCDIAVGAPLNSKPSSDYTPPSVTTKPASTSPVSITPSTTPAAPAVSTTSVAPGMNPAHGQPGHRCDIAVGAPLNSKPAATTPATTQPVSLQAPAAPVTTTTTAPAATTTVAPGMNPAHGQPGHRCDIAVGAPLNSAPKKN